MKALTIAMSIAALSLAGCVYHHQHHPHGMPPGQAKKVVHVHAAGCGHVLVGGVWVDDSHGSNGHGRSGKH